MSDSDLEIHASSEGDGGSETSSGYYQDHMDQVWYQNMQNVWELACLELVERYVLLAYFRLWRCYGSV